MPGQEAEHHYRTGLDALRSGAALPASECFSRALAADRRAGSIRPPLRYLSYYGLTHAMAHGPDRHAIRACEIAAARDNFDAVLHWNLGRAYLLTGQISRALIALQRSVVLDPTNELLRSELRRVDRRSTPCVPSLGRDHPLNRIPGRLRATWSRARRR
jgi:tetratricopeptide (TPR) repeat protein